MSQEWKNKGVMDKDFGQSVEKDKVAGVGRRKSETERFAWDCQSDKQCYGDRSFAVSGPVALDQFTCGTAIKWRHGGDFQMTAEDISV